MKNTTINQYYTVLELSKILCLKEKTIYSKISYGRFPLPYIKQDKHLLFLVSDVDKYIESCRVEANSKPIKKKR